MSDTDLPGTGIVRASTSLIQEWMFLPQGFEIVNAQMDDNGSTVRFTVKHKEASISPDGAVVSTFTPILETKRDEDGTVWYRLAEIKVTEE